MPYCLARSAVLAAPQTRAGCVWGTAAAIAAREMTSFTSQLATISASASR